MKQQKHNPIDIQMLAMRLDDLIAQLQTLQHPTKFTTWQLPVPLDLLIDNMLIDDYDQAISDMPSKPTWADTDRQTLVNMRDNHPSNLKECYRDIPRTTREERTQLHVIEAHLVAARQPIPVDPPVFVRKQNKKSNP